MKIPKDSADRTQLCAELMSMGLRGQSEAMRQLRADIITYSRARAPILIRGESGTGKRLVARAIHYLNINKNSPFIAVNCATISAQMFEREFFGIDRGALQINSQRILGWVDHANGGTLLLDDVNLLKSPCQASILRLLDSKQYSPIGSSVTKKAEINILATSNQNLNLLEKQKLIRKDLLYRLDTIRINVPSLRERTDDIALIARACILELNELYDEEKQLSKETELYLTGKDWPGNIRQLRNELHRLYLASDSEHIQPHQTPTKTISVLIENRSFNEAKKEAVNQFERAYLAKLLSHTGGNVSKAAEKAGKERRSFTRLLDKHGLNRHDFLTQ